LWRRLASLFFLFVAHCWSLALFPLGTTPSVCTLLMVAAPSLCTLFVVAGAVVGAQVDVARWMQRGDHIGLSILMFLMLAFDILSLIVYVYVVRTNGVDVLIMFAFEVRWVPIALGVLVCWCAQLYSVVLGCTWWVDGTLRSCVEGSAGCDFRARVC
jgi:hypothetical protein